MDMLRTARLSLGAATFGLALAAACGPAIGATSPTLSSARTAPPLGDVMLRALGPRALTLDPTRSVYDVVTSYWPNVMNPPWALRVDPRLELDRIGVYANGQLLGGLDAMRNVQSHAVARVRRVTPSEERMLFGHQHVAGALILDWAPIGR